MRRRGWRFNGQQYPTPSHGRHPAPDPGGVAETFAADLAEAVAYATAHADEAPESGAIYGGVLGG